MSDEFIIEIKRKGLHLFAILIPILLIFTAKNISVVILLSITSIAIFLDLVRSNEFLVSRVYRKCFGSILRKHEAKGSFTGATFFFISLTLSFMLYHIFFHIDIKIVSITYISFMLGDAVAALVGKFLGKIKIYKKKTLEGLLACFSISFILAYFVLDRNIFIPIILGVSISVLELLIDVLDDNLVVPFVSLGVLMAFL